MIKRISSQKKIIFAVLPLVLLGGVIAAEYLTPSPKSAEKYPEKISTTSSFGGESPRSQFEKVLKMTDEQMEGNTKPTEMAAENSNSGASVDRDNRQAEQAVEKTESGILQKEEGSFSVVQKEEKITPPNVFVKIMKRGAPVGQAEEIQNLLKNEGYGNAQIDLEKRSNIVQTLIFFKEEKFREEAQAMRELLIQKEKIYSALGLATSAEEKSADIVIMLGRFKEAPPN